MSAVRIATRRSALALWQARFVAGRIERELGRETALVPLSTQGDRLADASLAKLGGKGLFVKEIEQALLDGRADVAVHSAKDLPGEAPDALAFAAFPASADPRDALVAPGADGLDALPPGARVGTGSQRRAAQLLRARPDLAIAPLRGNVPTRLDAIARDGLDAVVLACAGLDRLGLAERIAERIDPSRVLPSVGQGALAIQARRADPLAGALGALGDAATATRLAAERACQQRLGADCHVPVAAHATLDARGDVSLCVRLLSVDGKEQIEHADRAPAADAAALGRDLAERALADGGEALLARLHAAGAA